MSLTVILDSGPLGLLTNPKRPPETVKALAWPLRCSVPAIDLIVTAIADYEVRRELERAGKLNGLHRDCQRRSSSPFCSCK